MKGLLLKCTILKADLLWGHQIYCLQACMCALFSPEILQAEAVKGLRETLTEEAYREAYRQEWNKE